MKSSIGLFYQLTVTDKKGRVVRKTRIRRSKSFVLAFLQILEVHMLQAAVTIKDVTAANRTVTVDTANLRIDGGVGITSYGTLIGTGATPPTNADYVMETLIANGAGAGEMTYAAQSVITTQVVGANVDMQLTRSIQNLSGNAINVTEAGIVAEIVGTWTALIVHDTFSAVAVADGETITATYTLRTTV